MGLDEGDDEGVKIVIIREGESIWDWGDSNIDLTAG